MKRHSTTHSQGFTVVELIVATVIFAIVLTMAVMSFVAVQDTQRNERYLDISSTSAQRIIEYARNGHYSSLEVGQSYNMNHLLPDGKLPDGTATLHVASAGMPGKLKRVTVDVRYSVGALTRDTQVTAVIGAGGITE